MGKLYIFNYFRTVDEHGIIDGARPVTLNLKKHNDPLGMKNSDIDGTNVGSKNRISIFNSNNYNLTNNDIFASGPSSLKRGITTVRNINPLAPNYFMPGHNEVNSDNNPYGKSLHSKKPKFTSTIVTKKDSIKSKGLNSEINEMDRLDINKR
jgi:hypothetical protein